MALGTWAHLAAHTQPCESIPKTISYSTVALLTVAFCFAVIDTSSELSSHRQAGEERAAGWMHREGGHGDDCPANAGSLALTAGMDFEAPAEAGAGAGVSLQRLTRARSFLARSQADG